jgi:tRNA 2-thiouridine synthesizing protein A
MSDFPGDETLLDARGWTCPLPVLRARKLLKAMAAGQNLIVLATDPGSVRDFEAFCRQTGNSLLESREDDDGTYHYRIRKVS